jgi:hypothetical protein
VAVTVTVDVGELDEARPLSSGSSSSDEEEEALVPVVGWSI